MGRSPIRMKYRKLVRIAPFHTTISDEATGLTENDVRLQFAREESTAETDGGVMPHKVTRSGFISEGLDIEEQQCVLVSLFRPSSANDWSRRQTACQVYDT